MLLADLQQSQGTILIVVAVILLIIIIAAVAKGGGKALIGLIIAGIIAYLLISAEILPLK